METGAKNRPGRREEGTRSRVITSTMETWTRHTRESYRRIRLDLLRILGLFSWDTRGREKRRRMNNPIWRRARYASAREKKKITKTLTASNREKGSEERREARLWSRYSWKREISEIVGPVCTRKCQNRARSRRSVKKRNKKLECLNNARRDEDPTIGNARSEGSNAPATLTYESSKTTRSTMSRCVSREGIAGEDGSGDGERYRTSLCAGNI